MNYRYPSRVLRPTTVALTIRKCYKLCARRPLRAEETDGFASVGRAAGVLAARDRGGTAPPVALDFGDGRRRERGHRLVHHAAAPGVRGARDDPHAGAAEPGRAHRRAH